MLTSFVKFVSFLHHSISKCFPKNLQKFAAKFFLANFWTSIMLIFSSVYFISYCNKNIYFVCYCICNKRKLTENWLEAKVNVVQIQKTSYLLAQLIEVYQHKVVPQKLWNKGVVKKLLWLMNKGLHFCREKWSYLCNQNCFIIIYSNFWP